MKVICFKLNGRFGHFSKAEAAVSALTYLVPPRTAILGLIGAVIGLEKDKPQEDLEPAFIAIDGKLPPTHWHRVKFRKDPPNPLPRVVRSTQKIDKTTKPEKASLVWQEWIFNPSYTVWISVPDPYLESLETRLVEKSWYYQPCLGLSEMMGDLEYVGSDDAVPLSDGFYYVNSVIPQSSCSLDMSKVFENNLVIHQLRMPKAVTADRVFTHATYVMERDGRSIPVITNHAYRWKDRNLVFL